MEHRVVGVDACRAGWIGVVLGVDRVSAHVAPTIAELVATAESSGRLDVVAIDIPIGLPDHGRRRADELARTVVGPRWASVFLTPVRQALTEPHHDAAVRINRHHTGEGVSRQAFGLRHRILEVDRWVRYGSHRAVEVHPEVSFTVMAGAPLADPKTTWAGMHRRRRLLADNGIALPDDLGAAGAVARVDDVLDAAAAAWSALRVARGGARLLPDPPETFTDGWPCAISA